MSWWQGILLGVVQGLTEFLPISSSGHLVVAEAAMGLQTPGVVVEVVLHVATLLAVVIVYWKTLRKLAAGAIAVLEKPLQKTLLIDTIRRVL